MPRKAGAKNRDHEHKRRLMVAEIADYWFTIIPETPSYRQIAEATSISFSNLRHYFPTAEDIYGEVLVYWGKEQAQILDNIVLPSNTHPRQGLLLLSKQVIGNWSSGMGKYHTLGLIKAFSDEQISRVYIKELYLPLVFLLQKHMEKWIKAKMLGAKDPELAARAFLSPILMYILIEKNHTFHVEDEALQFFLKKHIQSFLSGWW